MLLWQALQQTVDLENKLTVLDLCAAPGGKSTLLASAISAESFLLANEVVKSRVAPLKMNLAKWGHANVGISNHDPEDFAGLNEFFDVVLVDAPCSGEGLFRKDASAAEHWSPESGAFCAARQQRILSQAEKLVKPGGILIYSTCTFNELENEANVRWFLETGNFAFRNLQLDEAWGVVEKELGYQCYPDRVRGEGFFMAVLQKNGRAGFSPKTKTTGFKNWKRIGKKDMSQFSAWMEEPGLFSFFEKPKGEIVAIPAAVSEVAAQVGHCLPRRAFGLEVGQFKKRNFVPSHALALSLAAHGDLPSVELELEQALCFLKKENLHLEKAPKGWTVVQFQGLNLGWAKVLDGRTNNYLPTDWRIRMALK